MDQDNVVAAVLAVAVANRLTQAAPNLSTATVTVFLEIEEILRRERAKRSFPGDGQPSENLPSRA
jgi:hypothetical protein